MASLDGLTKDIAERFDLGLKAPALVQEVLGLIFPQPENFGVFLAKVKAAGLEEKAASWFGSPYPMALSVPEVKQVLDAKIIKTIAANAGVTEDFANKILGYAIPKIISHLAAEGALPKPISEPPASSPRGEDLIFGREGLRLVVPGAALLITLGVFGYTISSGTSGDRASIQFAPSVSVAQITLVTPSSKTSSQPSQATPGNETATRGTNTPSATTGPRKPVLVFGEMTGDFAVKAGWIQNLKAVFGVYGGQVSRTLFASDGFYEETTIANANRSWRIGSLWPAQVPQFVVAALTGSGAAHISLVPATSASVAKNIPVTPVPQTPSQPLQQASMTGDFAVTAGWIQNLKAAFRGYGGQIDEGTSANANRAWQIGSLWPAPVPQFVVAALTGSGEVPLALASATSELPSSGNESAGLPAKLALDFPIIIFEPNSATVPLHNIPFLRRVAEQIKQLPAGTVVLIDGYTQGAARPALNAELSQMRADSVYRILVREGVRPAMLSAKGYGSSPSLAGINGVTEGRSSKMTVRPLCDRRVEFRIVQQGP